jgi:hypothetical protein
MTDAMSDVARAIIGLVYGLILGALSFMLMGAGHGTYVPFAVSSAPLALVTYPPLTIILGLLAAPVLWASLARIAPDKKWRTAFLAVLLLHYIGVAISLIRPPDGDWSYFARMMQFSGSIVFLWLVVYVLGQALIWYWFISAKRRRTTLPA